MHYITDVSYLVDYKLLITFENRITKTVDLAQCLEGEVFEPLRDIEYFKTVQVNSDIDTIAWDNGADFAPEFLWDIGVSQVESAA